MGYPEPDHDEPIILKSRSVRYKSISFDAILTSRRIYLTASKNNVIPSQEINLASIRNIGTEENALRDHFLILSLVTEAGEKHQAVLTFARQAGVERKRECNEWVKKLKTLIPPSTPVITPSDVPELESKPSAKRDVPVPGQGTGTISRPVKKKVEIARQPVTVFYRGPVAAEPKETLSLPSGTFCSQCGNRIPLKSTFCNQCGTPVKPPSGSGEEPQPGLSAVPVSVQPPAPQPVVTKQEETVQHLTPAPRVSKDQKTVQPPLPEPGNAKRPESIQPQSSKPVISKGQATIHPPLQPVVLPPLDAVQLPSGSIEERQRTSVEPTIHAPEPLIKDSEPRIGPPPHPVPTPTTRQQSEPPPTVSYTAPTPQVVWPVFPTAASPPSAAKEASPAKPESTPTSPVPAHDGKKPNYLAIGILIMAILPILAGLIIVANIMSEPYEVPVNTTPSIPVTAVLPTQMPQTPGIPIITVIQEPGSMQVPTTGVWVRVSYPGTYIGLIGTPGNQTEVTDTGDHLYQVPINERAVAAALQKKDDSKDQIILEVYKNGVLLKRESSVIPKGIVEILLDLKTP